MKNLASLFLSILVMIISSVMITGCQMVGGIFDAGLYFGLLIAVVIMVVFVAVIARLGKK